MSLCKSFGKDKVIFATKEDHSTPSTVELPPPQPQPGLISEAGEINWGCPCLGGMATGPCGVEFRDAFSCFHYSEADPKGSDCYDAFKTMQDCFTKYPAVYNKSGGADDPDDNDMDLPDIEGMGETPENSTPSNEVEKKEN
ncbi:mitochondrial intermembrane space import and assembly protein 40-B [Eupeodes corollae]|uniref:mitochondrial intermembrane space import and assembly protein 40-B n=1 Tax=Eupeodes corollae TaxID=290404 RepID=UPI00248F6EE3|nr:mitochondrial intermembrane space import and assembly protein 40-B [Eupeodes corollae]